MTALVAAADLPREFSLQPMPGAANNRVFRLDAGKSTAVLKAYFQHPDDARDRGGAEFLFSTFAWERGIDCVARPMAYDAENALGLYEFVEGRQLTASEVTRPAIDQAIGFYQALNRHRARSEAMRLPQASEACFSVDAHLRCVEGRVRRLESLEAEPPLGHEVVRLVGELREFWNELRESVARRVRETGLDPEDAVAGTERCLSPSDFGFHNALLGADQRLRFIDFEYAGWDDPARLVCDFFCQPAVPAPLNFFEPFVEGIVGESGDAERHRRRVAALWPVYRVKWCCILLNDFLPLGHARRRFALPAGGAIDRQAAQLKKARLAFETATAEWVRHPAGVERVEG